MPSASSSNRKDSQGLLTATGATIGSMGHLIIDSCHSRWIFDTDRLRFRRVPKGPGLEMLTAMTEWRPYHELLMDGDSESFVVVLNDAGTCMLNDTANTE